MAVPNILVQFIREHSYALQYGVVCVPLVWTLARLAIGNTTTFFMDTLELPNHIVIIGVRSSKKVISFIELFIREYSTEYYQKDEKEHKSFVAVNDVSNNQFYKDFKGFFKEYVVHHVNPKTDYVVVVSGNFIRLVYCSPEINVDLSQFEKWMSTKK